MDNRMVEIGQKRLDIENRILQLRSEQEGLGYLDAGRANVIEAAIAQLEAKSAALHEDEQRILAVLGGRTSAMARSGDRTWTPPTPPPGGFGSNKRDKAAEAARREAEAVRELIASLEHELSLIGMSDVEKAKANALRQAGAAATDKQRAQIEALVTAIHAETEALEQNRREQEQRTQAISNLFDMGGEALASIADGSLKAEEAIRRLAIQLAIAAAQAALLGTGPLAGLFGGGLLANANGNAFSNGRVTPFAKGGIVNKPTVFPMAKGMGLMGEAGPEAIMPLKRGLGGRLGVEASGSAQVVHLVVSAEEGEMFRPTIRNVSQQTAGVVVTQYDRDIFPARFEQMAGDRRRRY